MSDIEIFHLIDGAKRAEGLVVIIIEIEKDELGFVTRTHRVIGE